MTVTTNFLRDNFHSLNKSPFLIFNHNYSILRQCEICTFLNFIEFFIWVDDDISKKEEISRFIIRQMNFHYLLHCFIGILTIKNIDSLLGRYLQINLSILNGHWHFILGWHRIHKGLNFTINKDNVFTFDLIFEYRWWII